MRLVLGVMLAVLLVGEAVADFPTRPLEGVVMWGAGGATDTVSRAVEPHAEAALGQPIEMTNRPGGSGALAVKFVQAQPSDGYTLLFGAENPQLHRVLGLAEVDYDDFYPVSVIARGVAVIVTPVEAPWSTLEALVADAQARPGEIRMGATGPGGLPHVVGAMLGSVVPLPVTTVPYEGEGPALAAMLTGAVDFMPVALGAASEHLRAGRIKALAVVDTGEVEALPGVPPITDAFPACAAYLPWGPFYGVFVKRDTPEDVVARLVEAFSTAASHPDFVALMRARGNVMMNVTGAEAEAFLRLWRAVTSWIMYDAGAAKVAPDRIGIPRP